MNVIVPDFLVERLAPAIGKVTPGAAVIGIDAEGRMSEDPAGAVGLLRYFPNDRVIGAFGARRIADLLREAPTVRWVQSHGAGVDGLFSPELIASDVVLTNAATIHTVPLAETVLALILAATKRGGCNYSFGLLTPPVASTRGSGRRADPAGRSPGRLGRLWATERRAQVERAVGPGGVVVPYELAQDGLEVAPTEDEQPVQALAAHGAAPPFGDGVRPPRGSASAAS